MLQNAIGQIGSNPAHSVALIHSDKSKLFVLFDSYPNIALEYGDTEFVLSTEIVFKSALFCLYND